MEVWSQTDGIPDRTFFEIQTSPENPNIASPWIITFMVDHPFPAEVAVRHPPLPPALMLESIRTGSRIIESKRWTAVEYWFIPQRSGAITLSPFEIITPDHIFVTEAVSGYVQGTFREYRPEFFWIGPPASLVIGESRELVLRLINWDPRTPLPKQKLFQEEVPKQAILEDKPLSETDLEQGILLRLAVIPLGGEEFTLKTRLIQHEGLTLEIPGLSIPLIPRQEQKKQAKKAPDDALIDTSPPPQSQQTGVLPEIGFQGFPLFQADYEKALEKIRSLWNQGQIPEALAEIRRNEREQLGGPQFIPLRREAERLLGFEITQDEPWRPRKLFIFFFIASVIILLLLCIKIVTSCFSWGYKSIVIVLLALIGVFSFREGLLNRASTRETGPAILREADAYRVPEKNSPISAHFNEGQL
ncbi:MAG: hypothetical protein LBD29_10970, partial [Treponema sp.]|nr:hypothetical protein [Treponema sp.]